MIVEFLADLVRIGLVAWVVWYAWDTIRHGEELDERSKQFAKDMDDIANMRPISTPVEEE